MNTTPIANWLPQVYLLVPGVPEQVARQYIVLAAIDFARESGAVVETVTFDVEVGVRDYYLQPEIPTDFELLSVRSISGFQEFHGAWYAPNERVVWLPRAPTSYYPQGLKVDVALLPLPEATALPVVLWRRYSAAIAAGAAAMLLALKGYDWYSPVTADAQRRAFHAAINAAKLSVASSDGAVEGRMLRGVI